MPRIKNSFHTRQCLQYASYTVYALLLFSGRYLLSSKLGEPSPAAPVINDLFWVITLLTASASLGQLRPWAAALLLTPFTILHVANMEMIYAMNIHVNLRDMGFLSDSAFLKSSFSHLSFPVYYLTLTILTLLPAFIIKQSSQTPIFSGKRAVKRLLLLSLGLGGLFFTSSFESDWQTAYPGWLSISQVWQAPLLEADASDFEPEEPEAPSEAQNTKKDTAPSVFERTNHNQPNVLLIVMEGIPGIYLKQVQSHTGVKSPYTMDKLSRFAENTLIYPQFAVHNRQTIRGLYSMMTGDYPKLSLKTPKVYEYLSMKKSDRPKGFAAVLAEKGYETSFLQAADLSFMAKDRFMPAAGFQTVQGKEYFTWQNYDFSWGPDDQAFFDQALPELDRLRAGENPWLLTLLTVGTHHPYGIPRDWKKQWKSEKEASIALLDEGIDRFLSALEERGVMEDTLVIITSDESHGFHHDFGRFWGTALIHTPEKARGIQPQLSALIDIPQTVMDYTQTDYRFKEPSRSLLRQYKEPRSLLFEGYRVSPEGVIQHPGKKGQLEEYTGRNGLVLSDEYTHTTLNKEEAAGRTAAVLKEQRASDSSLVSETSGRRHYQLLDSREYTVTSDEIILTTGQYLDIPAGTRVVLTLDAENVSKNTGEPLKMDFWFKRISFPEEKLPEIPPGKSLHWQSEIYAKKGFEKVWIQLSVKSQRPGSELRLKINSFTLTAEPSSYSPPVNISELSTLTEENT